MAIKRFCDRCGKEIGLPCWSELNISLTEGKGSFFDLGKAPKDIGVISSGAELCIDCHKEVIEFLKGDKVLVSLLPKQ